MHKTDKDPELYDRLAAYGSVNGQSNLEKICRSSTTWGKARWDWKTHVHVAIIHAVRDHSVSTWHSSTNVCVTAF